MLDSRRGATSATGVDCMANSTRMYASGDSRPTATIRLRSTAHECAISCRCRHALGVRVSTRTTEVSAKYSTGGRSRVAMEWSSHRV